MENCDDPNPARRVLFEQPVWQTLQMFMGEVRTRHEYDFTTYLLVANNAVRLRRSLQMLCE